MNFDTSYMQSTLRPDELKKLIDEIAPVMLDLQKKLKFDVIAFRGFSGASVAFPLSYATGIPLLLVRKADADGRPIDSSHGWALEGNFGTDINRYIILDDFICSGDTVRSTIRTINTNVTRKWPDPDTKPKFPKCVGIVMYTRGYRNISTLNVDGKDMEVTGVSTMNYAAR